jgi:predicted Zn-ribbon and HTH transcriptional regulator
MHDNPEAHTASSSLAQIACITEFKERQTVNTAQCNNCHFKFSDSETHYNVYWWNESKSIHYLI